MFGSTWNSVKRLLMATIAGTASAQWSEHPLPRRSAALRPIRVPGAVEDADLGPMLLHYGRVYSDDGEGQAALTRRLRSHAARAAVFAAALKAVADSPWRERLVLRGSVLSQVYLGEHARVPGDIDWVVRSDDIEAGSAEAAAMLDDLIARMAAQSKGAAVRLCVDWVTRSDLGDYESTQGRRLGVEWRLDGSVEGELQLDFAFGEALPEPPVPVRIALSDGSHISLLGVSAELSLAWKLLWLRTDAKPRSEDLYDATLLAESARVSEELWQRVWRAHADSAGRPPASLSDITIRWVDMGLARCPDLDGDVEAWVRRLRTALARDRP